MWLCDPGRSRPFHGGRQGGEDGLHIAARPQAENRAPVMEKIEFHIAAATNELLLPLRFGPGLFDIGAQKPGVEVEKLRADRLREGKIRFRIPRPQIVEENPADAARLAAMLQEEIFIAPFLVARMRGALPVALAGA